MNKDGRKVGIVHQLQHEGKTVTEAAMGQEVACSVEGITIGRQVFEEEVYYTFPHSREAKNLMKKFMHKLSPEQQETLNKIVEIQRKRDPAYAY